MSNKDPKLVPLKVPASSPHNIEADKRYVFNETGNIMLSTTAITGDTIPDEVRAVFAEVSVFFAAMTKAITTSIDPETNEPYSLYDYTAIQNVVDGSGLFVHVTEEDISSSTQSYGATFSKELIEGVLGLATGAGALSFAQGMIASLGSAGLKIGGNSNKSDQRVANMIFICEYLLGMPIVSVMVVSCDASKYSQTFKIGPCFSESSVSTTLVLHKDTYLFVTPTFIKEYAGDLESAATNLLYAEFIDYLQALIKGTPIITAVELSPAGTPAPPELVVGQNYVMVGAFLNNGGKVVTEGSEKGGPTVSVGWVGPGGTSMEGAPFSLGEVQGNTVFFVAPAISSKIQAVGVFFSDDKGANPKLAISSPGFYTAVPGSGGN